MSTAQRIVLVIGQLLVLAVFVWLFLPGAPGRTTLGRPLVALEWAEAPRNMRTEPFRDAHGVVLRNDSAYTVPNVPMARVRGPFTITLEARIDRPANAQLPLVSRWLPENGGRSFQIGLQKNLRPYLTVSSNGRKDDPAEFAELNTKVAVPTNKPFHLAAVFDPDERMALFLDGKLIGELVGDDRVPSSAYASSAPLTLGLAKVPLHGLFGPLYIFDRVLADEAIAA
ncbi:MAG TPA: LamG-like jellyroll fold domain-containing protein, partial [Nannocystis sp.]